MCVPWPKWSMPSRSLVRSTRASRRAPRFGGRRDAGVDRRDRDAVALVLVRHRGRGRSRAARSPRAAARRSRSASPGMQSRPLRIATRASLQTPATEEARRRAGRAVRRHAGGEAPRERQRSGRRSRRGAARRARRRREAGARSTTTTFAVRGGAAACAGAALTRSAAASASTAGARRESGLRPGGIGPDLAGGCRRDERVRRVGGFMMLSERRAGPGLGPGPARCSMDRVGVLAIAHAAGGTVAPRPVSGVVKASSSMSSRSHFSPSVRPRVRVGGDPWAGRTAANVADTTSSSQ